MSKPVTNFWNRWVWKIKNYFDDVSLPIAPIQWGPVREQARPPSDFVETLSKKDIIKIKTIEREVEIISRLLPHFPAVISNQSWRILLECSTLRERFSYIKFCCKNSRLRFKEKKKKLLKNEEKPLNEHADMVWNVRAITLSKWESVCMGNRTVVAHRLNEGPKLAVDCRYFPDLTPQGANLTALQLKYIICENYHRRHPMQLYLVNWPFYNGKSDIYNLQDKHLSMLNSNKNAGPVVTPKNYTEIFDPTKVVYLSPHATDEIERIEDDTVYVLGGIVDRVVQKGIPFNASAVSAKQDGVVTKKLPLNKYISWKNGTKFLTLTAMANIIHDLYYSNNDWEGTLKLHIPVRNTRSIGEKNSTAQILHKRKLAFDKEVIGIVERELKSQTI